ncbi:MAG: iron-siderophore ABC transporter substrate-binding protein, partial [Anaerolineae bacterium]|nr:iron-siderophore ABC transporter substrate-binding protein [Anaerolineae bacterium]
MKHRAFPILVLLALLLVSIVPLAAQESDAFPVTIEHKFGSTTITEAPQRVVAIGYTEQDFLLAVGVTPVAVRYWYGDESNAIFPWAEEKVEGESPIVLNMPFGSLNYEAILALEPDLISAVTSGITQEEYDTLSQIAPTIAQTDDYIDFGMPWQGVMQLIGDAVGKSAEAEAIVTDVEALFTDARANNPEFEGKTVAVSYFYEDTYGFYTDQDSRGRFFTNLGFVIPNELMEVAGDSFYADISPERIDLLDQDLIAVLNLQFIEGGREALESEPLFSQLEAVQGGRVVYLEEAAENALGFSSPLSLAYALNAVLPQLEAIFGGATTNDSTAVSCEEGFRLIEHAVGKTCVVEMPQRVVVLDTGELDNALALDAPVVGAPITDTLQYQEYLSDQLDGIADTGAISEPNFEAILALEPDLILGSKQRYEAIYETLSQIAPTVLTESLRVPWQDNFLLHAEALDKEAEAEQLLEAYDAHVAEVQAVLGDALDSTTISIIRFRPGQVRLYLKSSYIGYILQDVGLQRPPSQDE